MSSARPRRRLWVLVAVACVLLAAVCAQAVCALGGHPALNSAALASRIPATLEGWTVAEDTFARDPETNNWVIRTLNFNEYVCRIYRKGDVEVDLYWAHWNPGKMPARAVDIHTPDCCWVGSGYRCIHSESQVELMTAKGRLLPAERRTFVSPEAKTYYTLFWHLVDGKPYQYAAATHPSFLNALRAFAADAIDGSREQIFVTLSTSVPMSTLAGDPGFERILASLGLSADVIQEKISRP